EIPIQESIGHTDRLGSSMKNAWSDRVSFRNSPQDLRDMRAAAREFGSEAHHLPGRTGIAFRQVSECVGLASVAATPALAIYHLWKELHRCREHGEKQKSDR